MPSTTLPSSSNRQTSTRGRRPAAGAGLAELVLRLEDAVHAELGRAVHLPERVRREVGEVQLLEGERPGRGVGHHPLHRASGRSGPSPPRATCRPSGSAWGPRRSSVTGSGATSRSQSSGSKRRWMTMVRPRTERDAHEPAGTRVVERPGRDVDVVGRVADVGDHGLDLGPGRRRRCAALPSACRSCPRCRSSSRRARPGQAREAAVAPPPAGPRRPPCPRAASPP